MKTSYIFSGILILICSVAFYEPLFTEEDGVPARYSNAPGDFGSCANSGCHGGTLNEGSGKLQIELVNGDSVVSEYEPGLQYTVRATLTDDDMNAAGYQITALTDNDNNKAGSFQASGNNKVIMGNGREYLTHTSPFTSFEGNTQIWEQQWTAPAQSAGDITFYACGNAANGRGNSTGDLIYSATASISDPNTSSTNSPAFSQQFKIYPNPVQESIHLTWPESFGESGNITLSNLNGQQVVDFGEYSGIEQETVQLNVPGHLESGVYILNLTGTKTHITKQLIIE